jgi:hypothetical protein
MTTCEQGDKFRLDPTRTEITVGNSFADLCKATRIVDRLHKDFTEKLSTSTDDSKNKPTFHLRRQPTNAGFNGETAGTTIDRFYSIFTTKSEGDPLFNGVVSAILKGEYDTAVGTYKTYPTAISSLKDFDSPNNFKGIYGLHRVTELLEVKIREKIDKMTPDINNNLNISDFNKYQKRQDIKNTIEEIAHRENQNYREKLLNIMLLIVGIFIVSTQLVNKYFSFGAGGGGGFGFGGMSGWLSTRFGSGSSGLFSRFGGIGLGSSGRSRIGNLFTRSPYASTTR